MIPVSEELYLRNYEETDAPELFALIAQNRARLRPWLAWVDTTQKQSDSLEYIRAARQEQYDQQSIAFGIFRSGVLVGGIGMHHWDHELRKAEIGYWLAAGEEGRGTLFHSARALIAFLFDRLQLNKIEVRYLPGNARSAAAAAKLGFRIEGLLRESFRMHGLLQDIVVAGLLKREFIATTE